MKKQAVWNGQVIAESDDLVQVEGNYYFPLSSVNPDYLEESDHNSLCPWKGTAYYYHLEVDGEINENAAWYYPMPKDAAQHIKGRVAFWNGVQIKDA